MRVKDITSIIQCECIVSENEEAEVKGGYTSDLLSDVMANAKEGQVLITIQAHKNCIAVATLISLPAIIICNKRPVPDDMKEAAKNEGVALFVSTETQFTVSGLLYRELQKS